MVSPKVTHIANHPPIKTLIEDFIIGAFPKTAPTPPKTNKAMLTTATTTTILALNKLSNGHAKSPSYQPCYTTPTPIMRDAVESNPSFAPKTAALSHCALLP
ncbi:hypothetical protein Lal_00040227 [Lupinus albus]|nr:hypothetical protein Lal_00040227 [Lupinus albus]